MGDKQTYTYLLGQLYEVLFEPFSPVNTVLLFTVFTVLLTLKVCPCRRWSGSLAVASNIGHAD